MEQIETQASDLRYLTAPVAALSDSASVSYETPQPRPHMSPGSAMYGDNSALHDDASPGDGNANKRKSVDEAGGAKQTRSKRNRVSLCNCRSLYFYEGLSVRRLDGRCCRCAPSNTSTRCAKEKRKRAEALEAQGNIWLLLSLHIPADEQIIELFMPVFG